MEDILDTTLRVTQVKDGEEYKGKLTIDNVAFDYKLKFRVHINKLDDIPQENRTPEYGRTLFQFDVKDAKGNAVTLDDEMFGLFLATAGKYAIEFYNHPQTRDSNEGLLGGLMRGEGPLAGFGIRTEISMQTDLQIDSRPTLVDFLNKYRHEEEKTQEE